MVAAAPDAVRLPVLVVDDDAAIIRTLADILELHGYAAHTAATGGEGLRVAKSSKPALAVVDLRLPDMDGLELAHKLHELSEMTQVVVLTGNASVESAIAALREHSVDYLVKPVNVDHLMQVVSVAGERWQRRQAEAALRESEDRYRLLFERNPQPMWVEDRHDHRFLAVNDAALQHYGYSRAEFLALRPADLDVSPGSGTAPDGETRLLRHRRADGRVIDVELTSNEIPFGGRRGCIVLAVDVTQRLAAEAAMRQHQRLEAVGRLAGGVAHDFNNILTAITGYAEMLKVSIPSGDEMQGDVGEILKASERAAGLTRQLLAFSRQQKLQPRLVSLNDSVRDMENMLRRLIGEDVEMVTRLDAGIAPVLTDPGQLQQVLLNLCVNARDAMPKGGTLTIATANAIAPEGDDVRPDQEYVLLAVTDTGVGMDEETRSRIFEPFFTTKGAEKGTGLGLATVYGIITQSGGAIRVDSEPGRGTTFRVFLPASLSAVDARD
jgi:two-component system, cell cycle sensor histidine kinase and response regulator CckA